MHPEVDPRWHPVMDTDSTELAAWNVLELVSGVTDDHIQVQGTTVHLWAVLQWYCQ